MNPKEATWKIDNELTQVWYLGSDDRVAEAHLDVVKSEKIIQQCVDDAVRDAHGFDPATMRKICEEHRKEVERLTDKLEAYRDWFRKRGHNFPEPELKEM